ncbi:MAG: A/G-specific adenine glycosylase [Gammaproteobacteria bacterium]|nr:A/G-specific adenine glycosylase [Gammaproteobacteria bacterium]
MTWCRQSPKHQGARALRATPASLASEPDLAAAEPFSERLLAWYQHAGRHALPWKVDPTPYRVWLSEIMLQQTQVSTVLKYFDRFTTRFPDLQTLAESEEDAVLAAWTGLGYYRRARNLWRAARQVADEHGGQFPDSIEALQDLPGIGRSTAGAILALAFDQRATILDGNVKRVLCRIHGITEWPGKREIEQRLWRLAESHTPASDVAAYTQAIMDLGAKLCTRRNPACEECPVRDLCAARSLGLTGQIPAPAPRARLPERDACMLVVEDSNGHVLLERRPEQGVWGGLWCFPEYPDSEDPKVAVQRLADCPETVMLMREQMRHQFTHYRLNLTLCHVRIPDRAPLQVGERSLDWFAPEELSTVGLAAPVVRFLKPTRQH